ncbi:hypothetical protein BRADI_2g45985v3 [Brachypodium distachyon]|uniref:Transposase-associated domain-containing protein n=1 Tax=Brachypodium distachyon TaxID=15368 RepID=A0A2K2DE52_BRADI|nr:hypothetical protein BRADI_2g45985v3 [Brachypodium distachyon]
MVLEAIKLLLCYPRGTSEYVAGVDGFLEFAYKDKPEDTKILCPCESCVHTSLLSKNDIRDEKNDDEPAQPRKEEMHREGLRKFEDSCARAHRRGRRGARTAAARANSGDENRRRGRVRVRANRGEKKGEAGSLKGRERLGSGRSGGADPGDGARRSRAGTAARFRAPARGRGRPRQVGPTCRWLGRARAGGWASWAVARAGELGRFGPIRPGRHLYDDVSMAGSTNSPNSHIDGPSLEAQQFYRMIKDSEKPFWPGYMATKTRIIQCRNKVRVVQCHEEYMKEENMDHENGTHKDYDSSDSQSVSSNEEDLIDSDAEDNNNVDVENGEKKRKGTKLRKTRNLPKGLRIVVNYNDLNQPIEKEAGRLGSFLGMIARNGKLFLYPARMEKYILKTIGDRWRQHKSNLKSMYFDESKSMEDNNNNVPPGVIKDQWITLVTNWMSQKARKNPHRAVLYIHTHKHKSDKNMNSHVDDLKKLIEQQPDLADTIRGQTAWKGDALNKILGVDKPRHVHGLGRVPNPNQVFGISASRHFQDMNLTSLNDTSSEDIMSLRLKMEKYEQHMKNQDDRILELQEKTKKLRKTGARLGNEFWAVRVEAALAKCNELIRPLKKVKIIDHAVGTIIAWPSTFHTFL